MSSQVRFWACVIITLPMLTSGAGTADWVPPDWDLVAFSPWIFVRFPTCPYNAAGVIASAIKPQIKTSPLWWLLPKAPESGHVIALFRRAS